MKVCSVIFLFHLGTFDQGVPLYYQLWVIWLRHGFFHWVMKC